MRGVTGWLLALVAGCVLLLTGCERTADVAHPKHYAEHGLRFDYPGNWHVDMDDYGAYSHAVMLKTRGNAILFLMVLPARGAKSLDEFAHEFAAAAGAATQKFVITKQDKDEFSPDGENRLIESFSVTVAGVRAPHRRIYERRVYGEQIAFFMEQSSEEDLPKVIAGFAQVKDSFVLLPKQ